MMGNTTCCCGCAECSLAETTFGEGSNFWTIKRGTWVENSDGCHSTSRTNLDAAWLFIDCNLKARRIAQTPTAELNTDAIAIEMQVSGVAGDKMGFALGRVGSGETAVPQDYVCVELGSNTIIYEVDGVQATADCSEIVSNSIVLRLVVATQTGLNSVGGFTDLGVAYMLFVGDVHVATIPGGSAFFGNSFDSYYGIMVLGTPSESHTFDYFKVYKEHHTDPLTPNPNCALTRTRNRVDSLDPDHISQIRLQLEEPTSPIFEIIAWTWDDITFDLTQMIAQPPLNTTATQMGFTYIPFFTVRHKTTNVEYWARFRLTITIDRVPGIFLRYTGFTIQTLPSVKSHVKTGITVEVSLNISETPPLQNAIMYYPAVQPGPTQGFWMNGTRQYVQYGVEFNRMINDADIFDLTIAQTPGGGEINAGSPGGLTGANRPQDRIFEFPSTAIVSVS